MFPEVRDAVAKLIDPAALRWISWSHFEVDGTGRSAAHDRAAARR
jgi:hypothetical protein